MKQLKNDSLEIEMLKMRETGMASKAWPFDEARRILKRYEKNTPEKAMYYLKPAMVPPGCRTLVLLEK